jgi:putrescine---pyruvate transaminase
VADKATKAKVDPALNVGGRLNAATRDHGIIVRPVNDGIAIAPPLTIQQPELDAIASAIADSVNEVFS